jgi:hypothetical protein
LGRAPSERGPRGQGRGRRRGEGKGRPMRFKLVWRDSGEPVVDQTGEPILFRSKVQILRGPRYEALVGRQVDKVQLVDTQRDNQVVVDRLTLGPAPGGHR